jgi:PPOX class probable FMN-dependent enzyme
MAGTLTLSWKTALAASLKKNSSDVTARYLQLATLRADGRPNNRTVVFRGWLGERDVLTFVTDSRSAKVQEVARDSSAAACWYLPITREQFRLSGAAERCLFQCQLTSAPLPGSLQIIDAGCLDAGLQEARTAAWQRLSDGGRAQFAWPPPGTPRADADSELTGGEEPPTSSSLPLPTFCLVLLVPNEVDWVSLKKNRRALWRLGVAGAGESCWTVQEMNP